MEEFSYVDQANGKDSSAIVILRRQINACFPQPPQWEIEDEFSEHVRNLIALGLWVDGGML